MSRGTVVHRVGPFELDVANGCLFRGTRRIPLAPSQSVILVQLMSRAGEVLSKDALIEAGSPSVELTENTIEKAVSKLRQVFGDSRRRAIYIETLRGQGYRFAAPIERTVRAHDEASIRARLAPYRAFSRGGAELESLDRDAIGRARVVFEQILLEAPDYAPAHTGLAMACALAFEASWADAQPDTASLEHGIEHAQKACELDPESGDAWSTLAFVLYLRGDTEDAIAAARKARAIDPDEWSHALIAAYVNWGDERLRAARRVLVSRRGLALAYWQQTTVFIARGDEEAALDVVRRGCAAQDRQRRGFGFPAVGLHLLHGLLLGAQNRLDEAIAELKRELAWADCGQLYARECASNTWYALGAVRLRQGKRDEGNDALRRALAIVPHHASASAALRGDVPPQSRPFDAIVGQAIVLARGNRHAGAARVYHDAVSQAPPGCTGWLLPVEPFLNPGAHAGIWNETLALIRRRAT